MVKGKDNNMNRLDNVVYELNQLLNNEEKEIVFSKEDIKIIADILYDVQKSIKNITGSGFPDD